jgi:secreted trypsin-like serine protease
MVLKIFVISAFLHFIFVNSLVSERSSRQARVASGVEAKYYEGMDYLLLSVVFVNQWQKCGGSFIAPQFVLTSATCLYE